MGHPAADTFGLTNIDFAKAGVDYPTDRLPNWAEMIAFNNAVSVVYREAKAAGEVDIVLNGASAALANIAGLSRPIAAIEPAYLSASGPALLVAKDSPITRENDLSALRIVARANSTAAFFLASQHPHAKPLFSTEPEGALATKITKGELDGLAGDALALEARAARDPAFRVVRLSPEPTVILCRADDAALREALATAVTALVKSGELARISEKYAATTGAAANKQ
jgi:ABC-type amino acid transport substrate-binding protein